MSVTVVDRSQGIAGAYCAHLLAGAGLAVHREAGATSELSPALDAALRGHPPAVEAHGRLLVIDDRGPTRVDVERVHRDAPDAVIVAISSFGITGPWAQVPANEFTLQAWCGSIGGRGEPNGPPVQAGGHLLEWAAGTYAAVGALAALRRDAGEVVDVSMLEAGLLVTNMCTYLAQEFGDLTVGAGRTVEVPSILPAADGYVGVCTVTAQQFEDFLVMIDRPDLLADDELRVAPARFARREEFLAAVHAWSSQHSVSEVLDRALAFRVPAAPVLGGDDLLRVPHFVERGVFIEGDDDGEGGRRLRLPRRPYRITPAAPPSPPASPEANEQAARRLPLSGVRVVDLTAFLAGPAATHVLAALGADVVKVESPYRPDGMRGTTSRRGAPDWLEWGAIFHGVNTGKRSVAIDLADDRGRDVLLRLVAGADLVIENFTPRVLDNLRLGEADLRAANPDVILVRMPAYGLDGPWRDRSGFAQNMEQVTGLAAVTGHPTGPPILPRGPCDPIAGMHAVVAALHALAGGRGAMVEVPMVEAVLNVAVEGIVESQITGRAPERLGNRSRTAAPQGVYPAAGHDRWLALSVEDDAQWSAAVDVLGIADEVSWADADGRRAAHDVIDERIAAATATMPAAEVAAALLAAGVPAAPVVLPRDADRHEQIDARGFFEVLDHPVVGIHGFPTVPFRFHRRAQPWLGRPAPTVGEHTTEVLAAAGMAVDEIDALRAAGVVGGA